MIVHDLYVARSRLSGRPLKADTPLLVDPDGELSRPVASQSLEPIARQRPQGVEGWCRVQDGEPPFGLLGKALERPDELTLAELLGSLVPVAQYHRSI